MKRLGELAFIAGAHWFEMKSPWAGEEALNEAAEDYVPERSSFSEARSRKDFELMAAVKYPGALALGRHSIHRTYKNANLEKRWKGWLLCDQYRHGINPEEEV
ncbi:hypothetical protein [Pseudomonas phage PMBT14]|uniref:Uncharacterized protein n=1 Tax=Pseudomonas phage PMBT14 TaxID=2059855 RepID=A0A2I6PI55_9CAUD|nr:hypothetical protein HWB42_gp28 [Pseudomonas phage PMBT14]AUM59745.1 hypothetical protein [Pseudomonas phage PMBT14]